MEWISVKDRLPPCEEEFLVFSQETIYIGSLIKGVIHYEIDMCDFPDKTATHWMPLPEPPK